MFRRLLIANRGEVAARIARTARRLGVEVVAVASAADRDAAWLQEADQVVLLGPARSAESYLDQDALIEVARHTGCSAIHPGWGFLAENDVFAARVEAAGITFVGPSAEHLRAMGDKARARATMRALGLDPIPGSKEPLPDADAAKRVADDFGYPVLLKAVAGGGGRGMRRVYGPDEIAPAFRQASTEAASAFGDGRMYLEKLIEGGRHVEVQILADAWGNCIHLGERECSLQRRHQKILEEAPSPGLSEAERARVLPLVAEVVARTGYRGVGTVEMLVDADGRAWFMEMNTRLQVEHPVTEAVTGLDLVELQLRVAALERLPISQDDVQVRGHAIEVRINAEDPDDDFRPSPGVVHALDLPQGEGLRVDTHLSSGDRIPPNYDSMVAKLIVHGSDRADAIARLSEALGRSTVDGVKTTLDLHRRVTTWADFVSGQYDTTSLERWLAGDA